MPLVRAHRRRSLNGGMPVRALTLNGSEITDISRGLKLAGDGLLNDLSTGVWPATTNLIANGGAETNTTGITEAGSTTTRITTQSKFGSACFNVVTANAAANEGPYQTFTATIAVYAVSVWVRGAAGGTVRLTLRDNSGANPQASSAVTLTTAWQQITLVSSNLTAATWRLYVETDTQQALTFQYDGLQAELAVLATPFVATDGATAARVAARPQIPAAGLSSVQGWVAMRVRFGWGFVPNSFTNYFSWVTDTPNRIFGSGNGVNTAVLFRRGGSSDLTATITAPVRGDFATLIFDWTAAALNFSINGAAPTTAANANAPTITAAQVDIGNHASQSAGREFGGDYLWFAHGAGLMDAQSRALIHAIGNADPAPNRFPPHLLLNALWDGNGSTYRSAI